MTKPTLQAIEKFADRLTPEHRRVLLASLTANYAKIAEDFGIPVGTVKSRLNRARRALAVIEGTP